MVWDFWKWLFGANMCGALALTLLVATHFDWWRCSREIWAKFGVIAQHLIHAHFTIYGSKVQTHLRFDLCLLAILMISFF